MCKLISSVHISLDGFIEGPNGEMDWLLPQDDAAEKDIADLLAGAAAMLLGRVTYEGFAEYRPYSAARLKRRKLSLVDTRSYPTGSVLLRYASA